jgi:hypothetical protein
MKKDIDLISKHKKEYSDFMEFFDSMKISEENMIKQNIKSMQIIAEILYSNPIPPMLNIKMLTGEIISVTGYDKMKEKLLEVKN